MTSDTGSGRDVIKASVAKLEHYILSKQFAGYDPYDALMSPLFQLPILRTARFPRFAAQHLLRRLPLNIRPLLGIQKGRNPVTYGLCLQAFTHLMAAFPEREEFYHDHALYCLGQLEQLQSKGYTGACWGYDFDWEARYARMPAFTPTVVATGIVTNALFEFYSATEDGRAFELCKSAARFVMNDLNKTEIGGTLCFSYSPLDRQRVINATMKGARLLAQVYSVTRERRLIDDASRTVRFVLDNQNEEGSWPYSVGDTRTWVDNFHTGYVLDCLDEYVKWSGDRSVQASLDKGVQFYRDNFFQPDGTPKYYRDSVYPVDTTAASQSILTLARFGFTDLAGEVALRTIQSMQHDSGYFYYQRGRMFTNRISYMRWSNAWMLAGLASLLSVAR